MPVATVFLLFAATHLASNFVRSANAVLADDLVRDVGLGDAALGVTTSLFFLGFAAAQLPLGAALDRYGARRVVPALLSVAVVGSLLFAAADDAVGLALGRALLGVGTAGVLMGGLKVLSQRTEPGRFAVLSGALLAIGSAGALVAATPLAWAADAFGWRAVFVASAALLAGCAVAVARFAGPAPLAVDDGAGTEVAGTEVADARRAGEAAGARVAVRGFAPVFARPGFAGLAALAAATTGATFAFQSLWAGPYLSVGAGLSRIATGDVLAAFALGVIVGYGGLGFVGRRYGPARTLAICTGAFVAVQAYLATGPEAGSGRLTVAFALLGFSGASSALLFTLARTAFPLALTGRAVTAVNLFMFGGGFALQTGIGFGLQVSGAPHAAAFAVTAALAAVALAAFLPWARREARTRARPHA